MKLGRGVGAARRRAPPPTSPRARRSGRGSCRWPPVPLAVFALYPYLKRFTPLCHFGVGAGARAGAARGLRRGASRPRATARRRCWLAAFALVWVSGFDIIYATLDEDVRPRARRALDGGVARARARAPRVGGAAPASAFALRSACCVAGAWRESAAPRAPARCGASPRWRCCARSAVLLVPRAALGRGREPGVLQGQRVGRASWCSRSCWRRASASEVSEWRAT